MKEKYDVTGMSCAACQARVSKNVSSVDGVKDVSVNLLKNTMNVDYDESITNSLDIINAVKKAGYGAKVQNEANKNTKAEAKPINQEYKQLKSRVILSFIFAIPLFYLAMGHMMSWPLPSIVLGMNNAMIFGLVQLLLLIPIVFINRKYFINGFKAIFHLSPNMDSLVAIGAGAAIIYGIYALFRIAYGLGHNEMDIVSSFMHDLYFESAGTILALINLGKYFEAKAKGKTSEAITKLLDLSPKKANVLRNDSVIELGIEEIVKGDIIISKSGESIACDGIVIEGSASIDESMITGESIPVDKKVNDKVIGGTIISDGYLKIEATDLNENSTLQKIIKMVDEATSSKAPIAALADKIALYFVPIVISIALIAAIVWLILGYGLEFSLSIGISVLVVSCPCALGLATPTAIMVGTGRGASYGILFKSAASLEALHSVTTVVFDKTGTITKGSPEVTDIISYSISESELLSYAYSLEETSSHPLSKAVVKKAMLKNINKLDIQNVNNIAGKGITALYKNKLLLTGNKKLMAEYNIDIKNTSLDSYIKMGKTPLFYAYDNKLLGVILLRDEIKTKSIEAIKLLKDKKIKTIMLTGDRADTANAINEQVMADQVISEVLPLDKDKVIQELKNSKEIVAMVGDGINDSIALARADIGIAIGRGSDIAIESADVVLMKNEIIDVYNAILLSKATIKNIKENLFWAFIYNIIGIPVACGIFYGLNGLKLNPMIGALCMGFSSVFVVSNALRLRAFKLKENNKIIENKTEEERMKKEILIEGMMCQNCVKHVKNALASIEGLEVNEVNLDKKNAIVTLNKELSDEAITAVVTEEGYKVLGINNYEG